MTPFAEALDGCNIKASFICPIGLVHNVSGLLWLGINHRLTGSPTPPKYHRCTVSAVAARPQPGGTTAPRSARASCAGRDVLQAVFISAWCCCT